MFITLYGINNIGKTTQALKLVEKLCSEGKEAVYVKFPVYELEPTGKFLYKYLRSGTEQNLRSATEQKTETSARSNELPERNFDISEEELQMWFTLNRFQFQPTLKKWLSEGKIVIAEDYTGTGIAWGTVKGASTEWLEEINKYLIKEDFGILLDGERKESSIEEGHIHETNHEFMTRSGQVHLKLAKKYEWITVSLQPEKDDTANLIWQIVRDRI